MKLSEKAQLKSDFRIGLITFIALVSLIAGITFAGGDKGLLFKKVVKIQAQLFDVGGLKKGSSVTMNGMVVGKVTDITFGNGPTNNILVTMEIRQDFRNRIKSGAIPVIRTQGMLGDRYIDIPPGDDKAPILPEEEILKGTSPADFDKTLSQAISVLTETEKVLKAVNEQEGTAGQLVYDEKFYTNLTKITDELNSLIKDFKKNPRRYVKFSVF